ncbi:MAG: hypothetical protein JSV67_01550 [Thermoplasmatales archaeon]|nr:MAG: hypothetical protein JSV67_01550 [Thermoplasmatales archaeon]
MKNKDIKKLIAPILIIALLAAGTGAVWANSSGNGIRASKATIKVSELTLIDWSGTDDETNPYDSGWTTILTQNIKTPNQKDLFIDVSLETGLWTRTKVKSKVTASNPLGEWDTSKAQAQILIRVGVDGNYASLPVGMQEAGVAFPREVTFDEREQILSAKFMGIFTGDCLLVGLADPQIDNDGDGFLNEDPADGIDNDGDGLIDEDGIEYAITIDYDCLEYEELDLLLRTLSAHSFNFVVADLGPGNHDITVEAKIIANGEYGNGEFEAYGLVGQGSVVIESVRMVKGEDYLDIPEE